jgi:hypothetical protein
MGGFIINVSPLHGFHTAMTMTHHAVLELARDSLFLPMPDNSIHDKSKADFLAKSLVFCQVPFLVVQLIARKLQALPFTLVEIHTLIHVVCAAWMYTAWLGKLLDIKDPTDVSDVIWKNPVESSRFEWQRSVAKLLMLSTYLRSWNVKPSLCYDVHSPEV